MNKKHAISVVVVMLGVLTWMAILPGFHTLCATVILLALANLV